MCGAGVGGDSGDGGVRGCVGGAGNGVDHELGLLNCWMRYDAQVPNSFAGKLHVKKWRRLFTRRSGLLLNLKACRRCQLDDRPQTKRKNASSNQPALPCLRCGNHTVRTKLNRQPAAADVTLEGQVI